MSDVATAARAPDIVAFTRLAIVVDDAPLEDESLLDLDMLVQRQARAGLPAEEGGQEAALLVLEQDLHLDPRRRRLLPGQRAYRDVTRGDRRQGFGAGEHTGLRGPWRP